MNDKTATEHAYETMQIAKRAMANAQTDDQMKAACLAADYALMAKARAEDGDLQTVILIRNWAAAEEQRVRLG